MNKELLKDLGIDEKAGLKAILEELESKQFECLERLETVSDEKRREGLELLLSKIDKEIAETKEQIKALKSGIILDQGIAQEEETAPAQSKDGKKDSKPKENAEDVQKKVEALKAKEADKQAKETERQQKAAEKAARDAQASVGLNPNQSTASNSAGNSNTGGNINPELTKALVDYKKGDYAKAFEGFRKLAEANDETAQYMLANMYNRGEGIQQNSERAEFWMKRSADCGYVSAQLDYGILKLSNNNNDDSIISEGLKYVGMAADQDDKQAILKYIEVAKKQIGGRQAYEKAINYCLSLINQTTDSYDKERYESDKAELEVYKKESIALEKKKKRSTRFTIVGSILLMLSGLYLLGGVHPELWETNKYLSALPDAPSFLILPLSTVWIVLAEIMDKNGMFGLELVLVGEMLLSAGDYIGKKKFSSFMQKLSKFACVAIIVWHFVSLIIEGRSLFTALGWYIIVIAIAYFIGMGIGVIFGKIFKSR